MKKAERLKRCRYIGTGNPFEHYEKMWLDWKLGKEGAISPEFEFYDQFGLKHFNVNDGVPKGIKAYLFTAYVHWNDLNPTIEGFADWYNRQYIEKSPTELINIADIIRVKKRILLKMTDSLFGHLNRHGLKKL